MRDSKKDRQIKNKTIKDVKENVKQKKIEKYNIKNIFQTLILVCAGICIVYGLYTIVIDEPESNEKKATEINLQFEEVEELHDYISEIGDSSPFYETKRILLSTLDENALFNKLIILTGFDKKVSDFESCTEYTESCKIGEINYQEAITKLSSRYGNIILTKDNYLTENIGCVKDEDKYVCYAILGEIKSNSKNLSKIVNYNQGDKELQIFDKYLKYEKTYDGIYKCYIDNSMTQECVNQEDFNKDVEKLSDKELLSKYGQEYTHVYLKGKNDKFYWYSSQMKKNSE